MSDFNLTGKVIAYLGTGSDADRAIVIASAEAGADIALATISRLPTHEFGMASIANEVWVLGRDQIMTVIDAADPADVAAFADEVWDRFGRCDAVVINTGRMPAAPFEELSLAVFEADLRASLSPAFLVAQAFGRLMARSHGGRIVHCFSEPGEGDELDAGVLAARAGAQGLVAAARAAWGHDGVDSAAVTIPVGADAIAAERVLGSITAP